MVAKPDTYSDLLSRRVTWHTGSGFSPPVPHDFLFDFQADLVQWSTEMGRSAIFADCGLGKTAMQLAWADNVCRHLNKPVLLLTPLAVGQQTLREAEKFGIDAELSRDGTHDGARVVITNYERLHYFQPADFGGLVCDESSAIKNFQGKRRDEVTHFARRVPYRLLCTATAAPNDYHELGTSSEALGYLGFRDMVTTFFKQEVKRDDLGWGRTKYVLRGHAESHFWRWVVSWARALRKPSDLGYSDEQYQLPPLTEVEHVIEDSTPRPGMLFSVPARGMQEEREERRVTIAERCERAAALAETGEPCVVWCHLNAEGDLLEKIIPGAVQVKGSMPDDAKEEALHGFTRGDIRVLVTKPKIGCWGLNWQHCNHMVTFPSHSFEQYYQAVRRCWRFGQERPVTVDVIATMGEAGVVGNLRGKADRAEAMFENLVQYMGDALQVGADHEYQDKERVPAWL